MESASWLEFDTMHVRQVRAYSSMRWGDGIDDDSIDVATSLVVAAPFGGPIAVTRDPSKMASYSSAGTDDITICSAAGEIVSNAG